MHLSPFHRKSYPQAVISEGFICSKLNLSDYGKKFFFAFLKHCVEIGHEHNLDKQDFSVLKEIIDKMIDGILKTPCVCLVARNIYLRDTILSDNLKNLLESTKIFVIEQCSTELDNSIYLTFDLLLKKIGVKINN